MLAVACTAALAMTARAPPARLSATTTASCETILRELFGNGAVDAEAVAAACAPDVVWEDMSAPEETEGRAAVSELIASKFPPGALLSVERISDGAASGGFTWHREAADAPGQVGLRGTIYAELDADGLIS